jgi:prepilin-type N-terminal cleavage/methylation domain-containing protein
MASHKRQSGFTLIEIAVVMVIIGILLGSFIASFNDRIENSRIEETSHDLDDIKSVLMAYAYTRPGPYYLPCPDTSSPPDGIEDRTAGACSANIGVLPWKTLGAGFGDAWGTLYTYWVDPDYSTDTGFDLTTGDTNTATVKTRVNDTVVDLSKDNVVAAIYSHGKNSLGGIDTEGNNRPALPAVGNGYDDENENQDGDTDFMSRYHTREGVATGGGIFDDILVWVNIYELKAKMVQAGVLP